MTPKHWLDLSDYSMGLKVVTVPSKRTYLALHGEMSGITRDALVRVGFNVHPKDPSMMLAEVRSERDIENKLSRAQDVLPRARQVPFVESEHYEDKSVVVPVKDRVVSKAIARNRLGQIVNEMEDGVRFVMDGSTRILETDGGNPAHFLRASDDASLELCAEGFLVDALSDRKKPAITAESFLSTVWSGRVSAKISKALPGIFRAALDKVLAARSTRSMQDMFMDMSRICESSPAAKSVGRIHPSFDIAIQRMAGIGGRLQSGSYAVDGIDGYRSFLSPGVETTNDLSKADVAVVDLVTGGNVSKAVEAVFRTLKKRPADGVTIFVLPNGATEEDQAEMDVLRHRLAMEFEFENEALVSEAIEGRSGATVISIGGLRQKTFEAGIPPLARQIDDLGGLWTFAAETVGIRARKDDVVDTAVGAELGEAKGKRTSIQAPYRAASRLGQASKMVPVNLETAAIEALSRLVEEKGDIDAFVASEFGYEIEELAEIFSPEQIDALALQVYAEERGRAFLCADETGVGKGRLLAAIMRRRSLNGLKNVFMTERDKNLSDIWRDIVATKSDKILRPFIMNSDAKIVDPLTNEIILESSDRETADKVFESKAWPEGYGLVLGTYSQVNRDLKDLKNEGVNPSIYRKVEWFQSMIDGDASLTLDEVHNAAGDSNVSQNVQEAMRLLGDNGRIVFSSATYAPDAKRMRFYAPLFPDNQSMEELAGMLKQGGEPFQEVLSDMLVRDGVMVRREFDRAAVRVEHILDEPRISRNRAYTDMLAPILSDITQLNAKVDGLVRQANAQNGARRKDKFFLTRSGFGSPLHTVSRLFVAALKVDASVDKALSALDNGEKPVILVENTLQQLMEEVAGQDVEDGSAVTLTMRDVLKQILDKAVITKQTVKDGAPIFRDTRAGNEEIADLHARIAEKIAAFPALSVSIIDDIRSRIEEAGWTCDEITGRTIRLEDGVFKRRVSNDSVIIKNDFNRGAIDALVINPSGATGIDLHASRTFEDQRPRCFIENQAPADIVKAMQSRGRVMRHDQVVLPYFVKISTGLPVEMRLNAMENARLRSMSANTTSNRDSDHLNRDIPDLINPVGDVVCARYAEAHPDLMRRLGFAIGEVEELALSNLDNDAAVRSGFEKLLEVDKSTAVRLVGIRTNATIATRVADGKRTASEFLSRIVMLPVDEQTRIFDELVAEFHAAVEEMEARGEAPLKSFDLEGVVHVKEKSVFHGSVIEGDKSVFNEPLYALDGALERTLEAIRSPALITMIEMGEMSAGRRQACIDSIKANRDQFLVPYLPSGIASVSEAIERKIEVIVQKKEKLDKLSKALEDMAVGSEVSFSFGLAKDTGIVTKIHYPPRGREHIAASYGVEFVVPGEVRPRKISLDTFFKDEDFSVGPGLAGNDYDSILKRFDNKAAMKLTNVSILVGNVFKAMKLNVTHRLGRLSVFRTADGRVDRGVVLMDHKRKFDAVRIEMADAAMAIEAVTGTTRYTLTGSSSAKDRSFQIEPPVSGNVTIRFPKLESRRYAEFWDIPAVKRAFEQSTSDGKVHTTHMSVPDFNHFVTALYARGVTLWADPVARNFSLAYYEASLARSKQDTEPRRRLAPAA